MELTVLGCSGSYPTPQAHCSGYILSHDGFSIWMDAGNGTLAELQRYRRLEELGALYLSHVHADHCSDIFPFFYWALFAQRPEPFPIYTPPGLRATLECMIGPESVEAFRTKLDWRELAPGDVAHVGPFRLEAFDAAHSAPNNTLRAQVDGTVFCYSGDTGPSEHLARAARGADLFLCEASWLEEHRGLMAPVHLTARDAGAAAREAGAHRLMLTHIWPENDLERVRADAAEAYGGEVALAIEQRETTV